MARMIVDEAWLTGFMIALLLSIPVGEARAETPEPESIERLDEVEVTAARIAPSPRSVPFQLPDLSSVAPLPPDNPWKRGAPVPPDLRGAGPRRLLQDNTARSHGNRTKIRYLERDQFAYPNRARKLGWEGTVLLEVAVEPDGKVAEVKVKESSGHASLDKAAIAAVQGWRFSPERDGGFALSGITFVPVVFKLTDPVEDAPLQ